MYIKIKVKTEQKAQKVTKTSEDHFEISVKEKAQNNNANEKILEIIRNEYPNSIVRIISGHHSPSKILSIENKSE